MSGWIVMLLLAAAVGLGLWRWMRRDVGAMQFLGAALLLALAGYAWQGRPELAGAAKAQQAEAPRPASEFTMMRRDLLGQFDEAGSWLTIAEARAAQGDTEGAVRLLRGRLEASPRDMDLWLGLGDMLIQHAGGQLTPAAEMAFRRAGQVAPDHPAPGFFHGLALAKMGQLDAAEMLWRRVAAMPQIQSSENWRGLLEQAQQSLVRMRTMAPAGPAGSPPVS